MMTTKALIKSQPTEILEPGTLLPAAGRAANQAAARGVFQTYRERKATNTRRRQDGDLELFARFLADVGIPAGDLAQDPEAWRGATWGLVEAFVRWQLKQGYAVASVNGRLATVRVYAGLAAKAGTITPEEKIMIASVRGFAHKEIKNIDEGRRAHGQVTRMGAKKALPVSLTPAQAGELKAQPDTAQGRRDALLMCLLLDHGLRVGEVAALTVEAFDLAARHFVFYRAKVDKTQIHELTADTLKAARAYLASDAPERGVLWRGSKKGQGLAGSMSVRAMTKRVSFLGLLIGVDGLSPHDCRHYWATQAARSGTQSDRLQDAGGWSSPAMPARYIEAAQIANKGVKLH